MHPAKRPRCANRQSSIVNRQPFWFMRRCLAVTVLALAAASAIAADKPAPPAPPELPACFKSGAIHVICTCHTDIGWVRSPEAEAAANNRVTIGPALDRMKADPNYRFSMECTLPLVDFLKAQPERREEMLKFMREKRFEWGATYTQPYESLLAPEQLARELYFGRKWLKREFAGCDTHVAWNVDVPGRGLQMAQLYRKAGVKYWVVSRCKAGLYYWQSPDGSRVTAYAPLGDIYVTGARELERRGPDVVGAVRGVLAKWAPYYEEHKVPPQFAFFKSRDNIGPTNYDAPMQTWNEAHPQGPRMNYATAGSFLDAVTQGAPPLEVLAGEQPNFWLYEHGPTHHAIVALQREAGVLLPAAEAFATFEALLAGGFGAYPKDKLAEAWEASVYACHGWGGCRDFATDKAFEKKYSRAVELGREVLAQALNALASRVKAAQQGTPVVVFNDLSWARSDPVVIALPPDLAKGPGCQVVDAAGRPVSCQPLTADAGQAAGPRIMFVARDVPALGFKTYYVRPAEAAASQSPRTGKPWDAAWENSFYRLEPGPGGLKTVFDKQLGKEVFRGGEFLAGEFFDVESRGNGCGEFGDIQPISMNGLDSLSGHKPAWTLCEEGPVRTAFALEQRMPHATVRFKLSAYQELKRLDLEVAVLGWDGAQFREFRLAFPVNAPGGQVAYEVPFGVVEVGKSEINRAAGWKYSRPAKDCHPREVQNWMYAGDGSLGVTVSSDVAVFDYVNPKDPKSDAPVLQPVLLSVRQNCSSRNFYAQAGDHRYRFCLTSHAPGWKNGYRFGVRANHPLRAVVTARRPEASLPAEMSLCAVEGAGLVLTTVKKCDDDDTVVVRGYEIEGSDVKAAVRLFLPVAQAWRTNLIEEEGQEIPVIEGRVETPWGHHAIETLKLRLIARP